MKILNILFELTLVHSDLIGMNRYYNTVRKHNSPIVESSYESSYLLSISHYIQNNSEYINRAEIRKILKLNYSPYSPSRTVKDRFRMKHFIRH